MLDEPQFALPDKQDLNVVPVLTVKLVVNRIDDFNGTTQKPAGKVRRINRAVTRKYNAAGKDAREGSSWGQVVGLQRCPLIALDRDLARGASAPPITAWTYSHWPAYNGAAAQLSQPLQPMSHRLCQPVRMIDRYFGTQKIRQRFREESFGNSSRLSHIK